MLKYLLTSCKKHLTKSTSNVEYISAQRVKSFFYFSFLYVHMVSTGRLEVRGDPAPGLILFMFHVSSTFGSDVTNRNITLRCLDMLCVH